ncbi:MAG: TetR/AcrR family transcriptional regulator [Candidatus Dormibacteraeota bacterium]|nr:TetR/AcrR family transcriptional regulator [Candidatus Dormibacteraeota bacterium]
MAAEKRRYRMDRRADAQERTRLRITDSAIELHGTIGPSQTSISAVAALAGVRRSTVYRHFPDEAALFDACSAHWRAQNPPPDTDAWAAIRSPDDRLRVALNELHTFYERTEQMYDNLFRDETTVAVVRERFTAFRSYVMVARETLMLGRSLRGARRRRTQAALGHAIAFSTWKSLVREQGLSNSDASALLIMLVESTGCNGTET